MIEPVEEPIKFNHHYLLFSRIHMLFPIKILLSCVISLIVLCGCCDDEPKSETDNNQVKRTNNLIAKQNSSDQWLVVNTQESQQLSEPFTQISTSAKTINGIIFEAGIENSNQVTLQVDRQEILQTNAADLWSKFQDQSKKSGFSNNPIWEYRGTIQNQNIVIKTGSLKFSDKGDKILKVSFIISVGDHFN